AVIADQGQPRRIEPAQRGIGRGHQPATVDPHAEIARRPCGQPALEDRGTDPADRLAGFGVAHTLTLPSLRDGSLPLPQAGEGTFLLPSPACGRGWIAKRDG